MASILKNLEATFGRIPDDIRDNLKYLSFNEDEDHFTCNPCNKRINIVNDNEISMTKNFRQHFGSLGHTYNSTPKLVVWNNLFKAFNGKVPQVVQNNFHFIDMDGSKFRCVICNKLIQTGVDPSKTFQNFSCHLFTDHHENNIEIFDDLLTEVQSIYGDVPLSVLNERDFLRKTANDAYECTICKKILEVHPSDGCETEIIFDRHLQSKKHIRNSKKAKAFRSYPELQQVFPQLPNYVMKNIDYISMNQSNFFCTLCNENILNKRENTFETENNFKVHFSQSDHHENANRQKNFENEVYVLLKNRFECLPELSDNLQYLSFSDDKYSCNICRQVVSEDYEENDDLENALLAHFCDRNHRDNIEREWDRQENVIEDLEEMCGSVPNQILENIIHIEFTGGKDFECNLCDKTLKCKRNGSYEDNTSVTEENFEKHLESNTHQDKLEDQEEIEKDLEDEFKSLFSPMPQYITINLKHLGLESGNSDDYKCYLCDVKISSIKGNKKSKLTLYSLRDHFLSSVHMAKLKEQANIESKAICQLEAIFGKVPSVILGSIDHLELQEDFYFCTLCEVKMHKTPKSILAHLSLNRHQSLIKEFVDKCTKACDQLEERFWFIPEFLLKDIDHFVANENSLFCTLCQENFVLNEEDDLEEDEQNLRIHVQSDKHQSFFNYK